MPRIPDAVNPALDERRLGHARQRRRQGATLAAVAAEWGVSIDTARRHLADVAKPSRRALRARAAAKATAVGRPAKFDNGNEAENRKSPIQSPPTIAAPGMSVPLASAANPLRSDLRLETATARYDAGERAEGFFDRDPAPGSSVDRVCTRCWVVYACPSDDSRPSVCPACR